MQWNQNFHVRFYGRYALKLLFSFSCKSSFTAHKQRWTFNIAIVLKFLTVILVCFKNIFPYAKSKFWAFIWWEHNTLYEAYKCKKVHTFEFSALCNPDVHVDRMDVATFSSKRTKPLKTNPIFVQKYSTELHSMKYGDYLRKKPYGYLTSEDKSSSRWALHMAHATKNRICTQKSSSIH